MADNKKTLDQLQAELAAAERLNLSKSETLEIQKQIAQVLSNQASDYIKEISAMEEIDEDAQSILAAEQERYELQQKRIQELDEEIAIQKDIKNAFTDQAKEQDRILDKISKMGKGQKNFLQEIADSGVAAEDLAKALGEAAKNIPSAVISKGYQATKQSIIATSMSVDMARANFTKMTGSMQTSISDIIRLTDANSGLSATMGELYETSGQLTTSMTSFNTASSAGRDAMVSAAIGAERLGVSVGDAGAALQMFRTQFGQSGVQAAKTMTEMNKLAIGMKIPPAKIISDLVATGPALARYGKNAKKVFVEIAAQAKKTGIEVSNLVSYSNQFDEFDKAAQIAGSLNAALGGNFIDSMQLMSSKLEDRPEIIKNAIKASGVYFDGLSHHEKMHIMAAAGIEDHAMGMKMFSEAAQKSQAEIRAEAIEAERLAEIQKQATAAMDKLVSTGQKLAIAFMPLIDIMHFFADSLAAIPTWVITSLGVAFVGVGIAMGIIVPLFMIFASILKVTTALQIASNTAKIAGALASTSEAGAQQLSNAAKLSGIAANQGFAASALAAAPAIATLGVALLKAGLGALAFGAGIFLAGAGIYLIIKGMIEMVKLLFQNIELLPKLIGYTIAFAGALYYLASSFFVVAATAALLILAFAGLAIALIPLTIAIGIELAAIGLASLGAAIAVGILAYSIGKVAESVKEVSSSIRDMQDVGGIEKFITVVEQLEEADVDNLSAVMDQADRYVKIQSSLANVQLAETLSDGITKLTNIVFGESGSKSGKNEEKQVIKLMLKEDTFATAVVKAVKDGDLMRVQ